MRSPGNIKFVTDLAVFTEVKSLCLFARTYSQADDPVRDPKDDPGEYERIGEGHDGEYYLAAELCPAAGDAGRVDRKAGKDADNDDTDKSATMWTPTTSSASS